MKTILVHLDHMIEESGAPVTATFRASDRVYFDDVDNNPYIDCIRSVSAFSSSLTGDNLGSFTSSVGSIVLDNAGGDLDYLLDLACDGSKATVLYGDQTWEVVDFRQMRVVLVVKIEAPSWDTIEITVKDTGVLLEKSIGGTVKIGGTGANADRARPFNIGFLHQVECLVRDESALEYIHSDVGGTTFASSVRDKGVPINFDDNGDGTITLLSSPLSTITADIMAPSSDSSVGDYSKRRVSNAFYEIVAARSGLADMSLYGGAGPTFVEGDDEDYFVGLSISDAQNVISVLDQLTETGECFWAIDRAGMFTFGRLRPHDVESLVLDPLDVVDIEEDDMDPQSWSLTHLQVGYYRYQAYMNKNWIVQTSLADSLTPNEQAILTRKGLYRLQGEPSGTTYAEALQLYDLTLAKSPVIETLLSGGDDGDLLIAGGDDAADQATLAAWLTLHRNVRLPWLEELSFTVGIEFYELELGDVVRVTMSRYGLDAGGLFQVIGIGMNLTTAKMDLRLLRRRPSEGGVVSDDDVVVGGGGDEDEGAVIGATEYFVDTFTGTGDFTTHVPNVGGGAYFDGNPFSIENAFLDGDGNAYGNDFQPYLTSMFGGVPVVEWTFLIGFTLNPGTSSGNSFIDIAVATADNDWVINPYFNYNNVLDQWQFSAYDLDGNEHHPQPSISNGSHVIRVNVSASGTSWFLDDDLIASRSAMDTSSLDRIFLGMGNDVGQTTITVDYVRIYSV